MEIHSKEGLLFVVQIDHLTGECIGQCIDLFYNAGASNVQVLSGVTKKNRPSFVIMIDCRTQYRGAIQELILREFGSGGWHEIETRHCYQRNEILERNVQVFDNENKYSFFYPIRGKKFESGLVRPESDDVVDLRKELEVRSGRKVSYQELYLRLQALLQENREQLKLTI